MYSKSHLISFGNHLLKTYGVRYHSADGKNTPLETRQVSHADTEGWKEQTPIDSDSKLPSRFNFGDPVIVYFGTAGIIRNCTVIKIHFTESKVSYDVEVKWRHLESADKISAGVDKERELTDRLYNLDSAVVLSPNDFEDGKNPEQAIVVQKAKAYCEKEYGKTRDTIMERFTEGQFHETIQEAFADGYKEAIKTIKK